MQLAASSVPALRRVAASGRGRARRRWDGVANCGGANRLGSALFGEEKIFLLVDFLFYLLYFFEFCTFYFFVLYFFVPKVTCLLGRGLEGGL